MDMMKHLLKVWFVNFRKGMSKYYYLGYAFKSVKVSPMFLYNFIHRLFQPHDFFRKILM